MGQRAPSDVLELDYGYGDASGVDNGNVVSQKIMIGAQEIGTQNYTYDGLNRIQAAWETIGGSTTPCQNAVWCQNFDYDRFGNMAITHSDIPLSPLTPTVANGTGSAFNPATNRVLASLYDNDGNQKKDGIGNIFGYDAENRMTSSTVNSISASYSYDGDGHRVSKSSNGSTTTFVYNARGQLIAEYNGPPPTAA